LHKDGLVKSSIYVVVDLKRLVAGPHVLTKHRFRYYVELFEVGVYAGSGAYRRALPATSMTFYEIINKGAELPIKQIECELRKLAEKRIYDF